MCGGNQTLRTLKNLRYFLKNICMFILKKSDRKSDIVPRQLLITFINTFFPAKSSLDAF